MHSSFAAATLALAVALATVGTIWQVDAPARPAATPPTTAAGVSHVEGWNDSLHRLLHHTEQGLHRMAGLPVR
jgi:hypothetical protein